MGIRFKKFRWRVSRAVDEFKAGAAYQTFWGVFWALMAAEGVKALW